MECRLYLFPSRVGDNPEMWFLVAETLDGRNLTAVAITNGDTVERLKREGIPVKPERSN